MGPFLFEGGGPRLGVGGALRGPSVGEAQGALPLYSSALWSCGKIWTGRGVASGQGAVRALGSLRSYGISVGWGWVWSLGHARVKLGYCAWPGMDEIGTLSGVLVGCWVGLGGSGALASFSWRLVGERNQYRWG